MADLPFTVTTAAAATGTSTKTMLQLYAAGTNQATIVKEISISHQGITGTDAPIEWQVVRQSTAGTGGSAVTPRKLRTSDPETIVTTALENISGGEPTTGDVVMSELVHPQTGYTWQAPFGQYIRIKGSDRLGIRCITPGVSVSAVIRVVCEE